MQVVVDGETGIVKRWGFTDFEKDGTLTDAEKVIGAVFLFDPPIDEKEWRWNGTTFE